MPGLPHSRLAIAAFALLAAGSVAQSPSPAALPPIAATRAADSYAIYSLLISDGSVGDTSLQGQQVAIADTTLTIDDGNAAAEPDSQLQPPPDGGSAFQEAVQDYHARSQERVQLEHRFHATRSNKLLNAAQVAQFRKTLSGYAGMALFSEVYFNAKQTAALVYADSLCRNSCPNGRWIYLEKRDGQWHRHSSSTANVADTYAIYSLLMPGVPFAGMSPDQASHFAIAGTTVNINDMNPAIPPEGELQPPPNNEKAFQEAVQDFHTRRYERVQLERQLKIDRPYTLLTPDDVAELRKTLGGIDPGSQLQDKWAGYPGITYFSEVYFNTARTAALVYMNNFCANLCANGQWIYLEKTGTQWVRRSGLNI